MTKILEKPGIVICGASGAEFKHNGTAAGRDAAAVKAAEHQRRYLADHGVTDIRRLPKVEHVEDRSPEDIRRQRIRDNYRPQPTGRGEPVDKFQETIAAEKARHGAFWDTTDYGKRVIAELERKSIEWQAEQQAAKDKAAFQSSIVDLIGHAERSLQAVSADKDATVADCEAAEQRLQLAKQGERDQYAALDKQYRDKVTQRIAERAAGVESQRQTLAAERDAILAEALDKPEPVPEVKRPEPTNIPIDKSRRAVVRKIPTEHGVREEMEIVDAE